MKKKLEIDEFVCRRCLGSWVGKVENPKCCALCHSPYWNKDRLRTGAVGAVNKYGFDQIQINKWSYFPFVLDSKAILGINAEHAARQARSLEQFMRRKDWSYTHKIANNEKGEPCLAVMRTK